MEFSGEVELDGVSPEDDCIGRSDRVAVRDAPEGCRDITPMREGVRFDESGPAADVPALPDADPAVGAGRATRARERPTTGVV